MHKNADKNADLAGVAVDAYRKLVKTCLDMVRDGDGGSWDGDGEDEYPPLTKARRMPV